MDTGGVLLGLLRCLALDLRLLAGFCRLSLEIDQEFRQTMRIFPKTTSGFQGKEIEREHPFEAITNVVGLAGWMRSPTEHRLFRFRLY
jgi:hypothetical protein